MGGEYWSYFVPYQDDIQAALEALKEREFAAGRFWQPDEVEPGFFARVFGGQKGPVKPKPPGSIAEAFKISDATGTRSILDMERVSERPDCGAVSPLRPEDLQEWLGTTRPTREAVEGCEEMIEMIERGQGVYVVCYRDGKPEGIFFGGYSYD